MKHTPGPWTADEVVHNYHQIIRNAERDPVALVQIAGYGPKTGKANAHLIAAAPDMYTGVIASTTYFQSLLTNGDLTNRQRFHIEGIVKDNQLALRKAKGEQ